MTTTTKRKKTRMKKKRQATPVPQTFSVRMSYQAASAKDGHYVLRSLRRSLEQASGSLIEQHVLPKTCKKRT
jgi:hypothetical protein